MDREWDPVDPHVAVRIVVRGAHPLRAVLATCRFVEYLDVEIPMREPSTQDLLIKIRGPGAPGLRRRSVAVEASAPRGAPRPSTPPLARGYGPASCAPPRRYAALPGP